MHSPNSTTPCSHDPFPSYQHPYFSHNILNPMTETHTAVSILDPLLIRLGTTSGKRRIYRNYYSPKNENVVQYNTFLENFGQCEDVFDKNKERIERKDYRNIFTERVM